MATATAAQPMTMTILCCLCGAPTPPNASATCASCLSSQADITRGINTEVTLHQCRSCQRWHKDEAKWLGCDLESRELMGLCLEKTQGLKGKRGAGEGEKVKLTDASWIWTEPHSMRLKVKMTVQKEVQTGLILQQSFVVTYVVRNMQCPGCQANFTQGAWKHVVQVRQRVGHKRTFLYLEQVILKKGAAKGALSIEVFKDGMDFYFAERGKGERFIDFLEDEVPMKVKKSKKLIGTDVKSNISNYKFTSLVEICPLCKDDLLFLPKSVAKSQSSIARTVIVKNVGEVVQLVDPLSGQTGTLSGGTFWNEPFRPLITASRSRMTRYVVLSKEPVHEASNNAKRQTARQKNRLAELTLMKEDDMGINDDQVVVRSHVGYLCRAGDVVLCYNLADTNLVDDEASELREKGRVPDVVIVRKLYGGVARGEADAAKQRIWRLQRLDVEAGEEKQRKKDQEKMDEDEEDFLREVEADREMRKNMNLYKYPDQKKPVSESDDEDDEDDDQKVTIDELLDGLALDEGPDEGPDPSQFVPDEDEAFGGVQAWANVVEEGARAAQDGLGYVGRDEEVEDRTQAKPVQTWGKDFMKNQVKFT